jgi:2-polyprenyl-6-methoxyphenol hydroxylase-like FAD-dependent oxidoreductase
MTDVAIVGGSVAGLASAYALAESGYNVVIIERDPKEPPATAEGANESWRRPTVPQAQHSHAFGSLGTNLLSSRAPDIYAALLAAGARPINIPSSPPPTLMGFAPEPADAEINVLCTRRLTFEHVLRGEVLKNPRISFLPGSTVKQLSFSAETPDRVSGVVLENGRAVPADIVVDATGRRSSANKWLTDAGFAPMSLESSPADITYYSRFYRASGTAPAGILNRGFGAGGTWDHYTAVLFLGDNNTFSISVGVLPDDTPMKDLRHEAAFTAAVLATPLLAPWVLPHASTPISPVFAMGGLDNSLRGAPPVKGLFSVGDAACTTNPAYGRGVSLAIATAFTLADVLATRGDDPASATLDYAQAIQSLLAPWHADAVASDWGRSMLWRAAIAGTPLGSPPPGVLTFGQIVATAATDAVVWRRVVRMMNTLAPPSTLQEQEIRDRVERAHSNGSTFEFPGASREKLLRVVADAVPEGAMAAVSAKES